MGLWMIYDSKIGKVRERETYLDKIAWRGDERVLDVGCGLGLFLIGAAKRLSTGRAVGIDKWQQEDLSGNNAAGTLSNAMIEGVADKVEVHTGDARKLPFPDASFDVVLSSMALHNIYNAGERQTAVREIARVLKSGGRVLIVDVRHTRQYAATLRDAGLDARCVQGIVSYLLTRDHVRLDSIRLRDRQQGGAGLDGADQRTSRSARSARPWDMGVLVLGSEPLSSACATRADAEQRHKRTAVSAASAYGER